jgi:RNA polymerase sigma-70 factor (ECF subfamily)
MIVHGDCDCPRAPRDTFDEDVLAVKLALRAFARRLCRNETDVEDLVQETLVKAFRHRELFQPGTKLKSWLFSIMRNHFNTQYFQRKRESTASMEDIELSLTCMPGQDWVLYQAEAERIIQKMAPERRSALLQISAGISYEDAAASLGCEVGTIKSRVNRARSILIAELGDIFSSRDWYAN